MRIYRAAIIGTGRIGSLLERDALRSKPHTHAGWYAAHPLVTLVAGADLDAERLHQFGEDWSITPDHLYADYHEMLERERPDLVSICAYAPDRVEMARAAIERGVRGLWLEKAVACSMAEAESLHALAKRARVAIVVNHTRRADPAWRRVSDLIASGDLGRLETVHCLFSGHFIHTGTHAWDLLDEWCGPWTSVQCWPQEAHGRTGPSAHGAGKGTAWRALTGAEAVEETPAADDDAEDDDERRARPSAAPHASVGEASGWAATPGVSEADPREPGTGSLEPESDPDGVAHIRFENGVHAFVSGSRKRYFIFECDLVFTAGRIQIGNDVRRVYRPAPSPRYEGFVELAETREPLAGSAPASLLDALIDAVETGNARLDSLDAASRALHLGLAIVCAAERPGERVTRAGLPTDLYVASV